MKLRPALTLVELVLVISLIAILTAGALVSFTGSRRQYALKFSSENLVNELRRAHIFSRENRDDKSWGIRILDSKNYILINRDVAGETIKYTFRLPESVTFETSGIDIWFDQVTGNTASDINFGILSDGGMTKIINISQYGIITVN
jgi:type II secretory pathway pseudopilin PulG